MKTIHRFCADLQNLLSHHNLPQVVQATTMTPDMRLVAVRYYLNTGNKDNDRYHHQIHFNVYLPLLEQEYNYNRKLIDTFQHVEQQIAETRYAYKKGFPSRKHTRYDNT